MKRRKGRRVSGGGASQKVNYVVGCAVLKPGRQLVVDLIGERLSVPPAGLHIQQFSLVAIFVVVSFTGAPPPTLTLVVRITHDPPSIVRAHVSTSLVRITCYRKMSQHVFGSSSRMKSGRSSFWSVSKCTHL